MDYAKINKILHEKDLDGRTFFHKAAESKFIVFLLYGRELLKYPNYELLNKKDNNGLMCTHIIAFSNVSYASKMMEIVVKLGADLDGQEDNYGLTPLHICVLKKNYSLAKYLCRKYVVNLEVKSKNGFTPYQIARLIRDKRMMIIPRKFEEIYKALFINKDEIYREKMEIET